MVSNGYYRSPCANWLRLHRRITHDYKNKIFACYLVHLAFSPEILREAYGVFHDELMKENNRESGSAKMLRMVMFHD